MPLSSKRRAQWRTVLAHKGVKVSIFALARAVLSGQVPRHVWRERMRICAKCPVYDKRLKACRKLMPSGVVLGCSCYTPFLALTAVPYTKEGGCWAREVTRESDAMEGWPAYLFPSRWAKIRAIVKFILQ